MRIRSAPLFAFLFIGAAAAAQPAQRGPPVSVKLLNILVRLEGDSTLHGWSSQTRAASVRGRLPSVDPREALAGDGEGAIEVVIPVATLRSGTSGLDRNLYAALRKDEFPEITFRLSTWRAEPDPAGVYRVRAQGTLSIAGVAREVTLEAEARVADGAIHASGEVPLMMTRFGVKPPSFFGGAMKASDEVKVKFNAVFKPVPTTDGER